MTDCVNLFLDEPFSALDYELVSAMSVILSREASRGRRIVVVTHDVRAAAFLADDILHVADGAVGYRQFMRTSRPLENGYFLSAQHHEAMKLLIEMLHDGGRPVQRGQNRINNIEMPVLSESSNAVRDV